MFRFSIDFYFLACTPGDVAYVNPNTHLPYECNAALSNSCPSNFICTYDQLSGNSVCCGATNMGNPRYSL